jgi:hypothetical protein
MAAVNGCVGACDGWLFAFGGGLRPPGIQRI